MTIKQPLPPLIPDNKPDEIKAYRTTDGRLHESRAEAVHYQLNLDMKYWDKNQIHTHAKQDALMEQIFYRASSDPEYLKALKAFVKRLK